VGVNDRGRYYIIIYLKNVKLYHIFIEKFNKNQMNKRANKEANMQANKRNKQARKQTKKQQKNKLKTK
jgi:hypothetical protein